MKQEFICINCQHEWTEKPDKDGLFNGKGMPDCPKCGDMGYYFDDFADYECDYCNHKWRQYGNGGLVLGCVPKCPECKR